MAKHSLRIDFDGATNNLVVAITSADSIPGGPVAKVAFPLNFDPEKPAPELKRREGESDDAYSARLLKEIPAQLDVPAELDLTPLKNACRAIIEHFAEVGEHFARRAAAVHALDAVGKVPEGVTHKIRLGRKGKPATGDTKTEKK